ncbi:exonuclease [Gordonia phage OneUp]|uniref:Exodeoxyribonuclease VII small subunit n=1 Tax=Gordonia phage OneUp TaxID=1838074 RepID=A0A160DEW4_9CAUD|nr:exonuclease [Gordonia phage OneUp]ANA86392.1 exodeoxyribonuclease VII small subunit [Gordonia phage OneUp]
MTYEEAQAELEQITRTIASGKMTITELLPAWQRALELKGICEEHLRVARESLADVIEKANS